MLDTNLRRFSLPSTILQESSVLAFDTNSRMQYPRGTTNLPVEIWHNCWSNLFMPELLTLSMTCRLFHDICRPHIFGYIVYLETTEVNELVSDQEYKKWEKRAAHFEGKLKWLASDPIRARYPRFFVFTGLARDDIHNFGLQRPEFITAYDSLLSTFKASLGLFTSLRYVRIEDIELDEEVMLAFAKISLLKGLCLHGVDLSCTSPSPLLHPTDLRISEWEWDPQERVTTPWKIPPIFSNQGLRTIDIQSFRYALPCLQHFISQGTSEVLTTLKIIMDVNILPTLFAFLETCPNLRNLVASTGRFPKTDFNPIYPSLPSSALPNLCRFDGVAGLAAVLVPGRPVHRIILKEAGLGSTQGISSILHELTKSSVVVKALTLPYMDIQTDIFHAISKAFPKLESLRLHLSLSDADRLNVIDDDSVPDEEYFDLTTPTKIDSIPFDENGCPIVPPTTFKGVIYWLCHNKLPLPTTIQKLEIHQKVFLPGFQGLFKTCLSFGEQQQASQMLSSHLPNLKFVTFGGPHVQWVLDDDGEWRPGENYQFFIRRRHHILETSRNNDAPQPA